MKRYLLIGLGKEKEDKKLYHHDFTTLEGLKMFLYMTTYKLESISILDLEEKRWLTEKEYELQVVS